MPLRNFSDGGVFDRTRRFHAASPASASPARSPTRGSGLGAAIDAAVGAAAADAAPAVDAAEPAHADSAAAPNAAPRSESSWVRTSSSTMGGLRRPSFEQQRAEHALHARDLRRLIDLDVVRELED